ncbi:MAG: sensor histidine kinase, partial [Rhodospirillales bacterium]|nr:sensor histidine kinase [Rhodospirillales bacterium]
MNSLSIRLMVSAGVWIMLVLIVGGVSLSFAFQQSADASFRRQLEVSVNALIAMADFQENQTLTVSRSLDDPRFEQALSGWYWQISAGDTTLAHSRSLWDASLPLAVPASNLGRFGATTFQGPRGRALW